MSFCEVSRAHVDSRINSNAHSLVLPAPNFSFDTHFVFRFDSKLFVDTTFDLARIRSWVTPLFTRFLLIEMGSFVQRRSAIFLLVLSLTLILPWTASAASAVLGIDLGTKYIKAALVKPGIPLEIVPTKDSKRKEISAVAFKPGHRAQKPGSFPERLYGSDAVALAARFPNDVYPNLRSLLGQTIKDSTLVNTYRETYPALDLVAYEDRNTTAFYSTALGKEEAPLTVEELLAMELQNIRSNAESLAGKNSKVEAVVMTIPSFFTADEIRALELAGELAGLKILGLLSDGLAVGINYATSRIFPSIADGGKAETHLVFDMGAGSTTATVLQFQGRIVKSSGQANKTVQEVNVLGTGYDRFLGGEVLNAVIFEHMVDEFVKVSDAQEKNVTPHAVKTHGRAAAKLWKEAERIRQVLSANSETFASFEDLYDNIDFRYKLTRSQFESMASTFAERVAGPVQQALEAAKLTKNGIDSIILHGGATRTPFVQSRLEKVIGDAGKIRSNVNSDEAAVFGAAFKGAGLSPNFRVKDIQTRDATPYSVNIRWFADGKGKMIITRSDIMMLILACYWKRGARKFSCLVRREELKKLFTSRCWRISSSPSTSMKQVVMISSSSARFLQVFEPRISHPLWRT